MCTVQHQPELSEELSYHGHTKIMKDGSYNSKNRFKSHGMYKAFSGVNERKRSGSGTQLKKQYYEDSDDDDNGNNRIKDVFCQLWFFL